MRKRLTWTTLVAAALSALGFVTLGLPGFAILAAATGPAKLLGPPELVGDQVWPAALGIGMLGPFALVPVYLGIARMVASRMGRILLTAAVTLAIDVALCCAVPGLFCFLILNARSEAYRALLGRADDPCVLASCPAHMLNQITTEPRKHESA